MVFLLIAAGGVPQGLSQKTEPEADNRLETVYQHHIAALGGNAKLSTLKTYQYTTTNSDGEQKATLSFKKPGLFIKTFKTDKGQGAELIRGSENWHKHTDGTATKYDYPTGVTRDVIRWSLHGFLWDAKHLNYELELLQPAEAAEKVSSAKIINKFKMNDSCLVIKARSAAKDALDTEFTIYIDPETYLINVIVENNEYSMNSYIFWDYAVVDGMRIFTKVGWGAEGKTEFTLHRSNVRLNVALDDKLFVPPTITKK